MENRTVIATKEREHSKTMNEEAVNRIKAEEKLAEAGENKVIENKSEAIFFEDDEVIHLRDGKEYRVAPCSLKDARKLMNHLKTVNVDAIVLNFAPTGDDAMDAQREDDLMNILKIAFKGYPHVTNDYIEEYVDLDIARRLIDIMLGLNGLKK